MGCSASKSKDARAAKPPQTVSKVANANAGAPPNGPQSRIESNVPPSVEAEEKSKNSSLPKAIKSPSNRSVETPAGQAAGLNDANNVTDAAPMTATDKVQRSNTSDISEGNRDDGGNAVVLPKGVWIKTEGTPYYYCASENLYYHPPSCQFYDPTNEMWYDPDKDEWYHDDSSNSEAA